MSRQQTFAPDDPERNNAPSTRKKHAPWVLWFRWDRWGKKQKPTAWRVKARYRSKEDAEKMMESQKRKDVITYPLTWHGKNPKQMRTMVFPKSYRVMHEDDGKPK